MISGLHHYSLELPDLAVADSFLQDFGLTTAEKDGALVARCHGRGQEQVRMVEGPAKRLHHVSFTLWPDSLDRVREALDRAGTPIIEPRRGAPDGSPEQRPDLAPDPVKPPQGRPGSLARWTNHL